MPASFSLYLTLPSESRLSAGYLYAEPPVRQSRKKVTGELFKKALEKFCNIRIERQAHSFIRKFGIPTNKLNDYGDSVALNEILGLSATLSWVRHLINCQQANSEDGLESMKVIPRPNDHIAYWKANLTASEMSKLLKIFPEFKTMGIDDIRLCLIMLGVINIDGATDPVKAQKFRADNRALADWLKLQMTPLTESSWFAVIPDSLLKSTLGWQTTIQLWGSQTPGVGKDIQDFAVPEATALAAKNRMKYLVDQTLRRYFKELLPIRCSVTTTWIRQFSPPTSSIIMDTLLDGMLNQLLVEWQSSKYKPCLNSKCNKYIEFKRSTKLFCSNRCRMAHKRTGY